MKICDPECRALNVERVACDKETQGEDREACHGTYEVGGVTAQTNTPAKQSMPENGMKQQKLEMSEEGQEQNQEQRPVDLQYVKLSMSSTDMIHICLCAVLPRKRQVSPNSVRRSRR